MIKKVVGKLVYKLLNNISNDCRIKKWKKNLICINMIFSKINFTKIKRGWNKAYTKKVWKIIFCEGRMTPSNIVFIFPDLENYAPIPSLFWVSLFAPSL